MTDRRQFHVLWHEHYFSAHCADEVHGRFDAMHTKEEGFFVLDVGNWTIVRTCPSKDEANALAKRLAQEYVA